MINELFSTQYQELTASFDDMMRKREHEFRLQSDEMKGTVLAHEIKVKLETNITY